MSQSHVLTKQKHRISEEKCSFGEARTIDRMLFFASNDSPTSFEHLSIFGAYKKLNKKGKNMMATMTITMVMTMMMMIKR